MDKLQCPSCRSHDMTSFYKIPSVPANSCLLFDTAAEAMAYPCGEIDLRFCDGCGFISNMAFDTALTEYSSRYEETQGCSRTFQQFHQNLAERLLQRHDLQGRRILEIGCGKGEFLTLLSELGNNEGIGFDPGYHDERTKSDAMDRLTFIKDFYSEKYADYSADFICCKMTLEHIHATADFIGTLRAGIGDATDTIVFFQVPEAMRIIRDCAFEDIYYEHCSYFSPGSLASLFRRAGFRILDLSTEYDDQYLTIEAQPVDGPDNSSRLPNEESMEELRSLVASFPDRCSRKINEWRHTLTKLRQDNARVVLWGSGSKAVSFLTTVDSDRFIEYAVDINPYRHNHYMPKTGQKIIDPEFLKEYRPDAVIIMNRIYTNEISADLNAMGLSPTILAL